MKENPCEEEMSEREDEFAKNKAVIHENMLLLFWIQKREKEIAGDTESCHHPKYILVSPSLSFSSLSLSPLCLSFHSFSSTFDPFD